MNSTKQPVLIVDDETNLRESLAELVESEGFAVTQARDGGEAIEILRAVSSDAEDTFAVVFLDVRMPRMDGFQVLDAIRDEALTDAPVIVVSAFGASTDTIEAMRRGAYDYITKPLDIDEILRVLNRAAEQHRLSRAKQVEARDTAAGDLITTTGKSPSREPEIIGTSRVMRDVFKQIGRLSATDATTLITGESGTGKELVALAIHNHSARSKQSFVPINCGALPENLIEAELFGHERGAFTGAERQRKGRFELADKGTLFLDEIGELTPPAQVKLLRALQERRFERVGGTETISTDVRVIAATNRDLKTEVQERRFREDLFYRIGVIEIHLPALRERLTDVPQLAEYFIEAACARHNLAAKTLSDAALRALLDYDFPGNVRELQNLCERAVVTSGANLILPEHLFDDAAPELKFKIGENEKSLLDLPFHEAVATLERELIRRALKAANGNRSDAARRLGINRRLLYSKLEEHQAYKL
ncbi:MAG: sigma-54 dependent transcriptional regulator [Pyrinomonadaceae bacterium MAG19_C2-C3]|nr:sigma-54 dependent transcriptional regulator [Pyrinomonadaceae bacterium MAG19_C2-C3]